MLVSGCGWKVLLEGVVQLACWCWLQGVSSDLANLPRFRIGKFEV